MSNTNRSLRRASRSSSHRGKTAQDIPPGFRIPGNGPLPAYQPPQGQRFDLPYPQTPATGTSHVPMPREGPSSPPSSRLSGSRTENGGAGRRASYSHLDSAKPQPGHHVHGNTHIHDAHELHQVPDPFHVQQQGFCHPERPPTPPASVTDHFGNLGTEDDMPVGSEAASFRRSQSIAGARAAVLSDRGDGNVARAGGGRSQATSHSHWTFRVSRRSSRSRTEEIWQHPRPRGEADAYYDENARFGSNSPNQHVQSQQYPQPQQAGYVQEQPHPAPQTQHAHSQHKLQHNYQQDQVRLSPGPIGLLKEYTKARLGDEKFQEGGHAWCELLRRTNEFWNEGKTGKTFNLFRFHPEKRSRFKQLLDGHDSDQRGVEQRAEQEGDAEPMHRQHDRSQSCWCLTELRTCGHEGHSVRLHICPRRSCKNAERAK